MDIKVNLTLDNVSDVVAICRNYKKICDIDIACGSHCVDGCSILGVMYLAGHEVTVRPLTDDLITIGILRENFARLEEGGRN